MNLIFGDETRRLTLSGTDGSVLSFRYNREELLLPAPGFFNLRLLRHQDGEFRFVDSLAFPEFSENDGLLCWRGHPDFPNFAVECRVGFDGNFFRFRSAFHHVPPEYWIDLVEMPRINAHYNQDIFWPHSFGCLVSEPWKSSRVEHHAGFPGNGDPAVYPGTAPVQFFAAYRGKCGVYYAADDPAHSIKTMEIGPRIGDAVRLRIECTCGENGTKLDFQQPFDLVLGAFEGDWRDACELQREAIRRDPVLKRDFPLPEWYEASPTVVIYPVCGSGRISSEPNRFLPYESAFPRIQELAAALDSRIMVLLMRWDRNGPWIPPYYWPPIGGADSFCKFRDLLHEAGHLIGLYGSGTSYTRKSLISDYCAEAEYQSQNLERFMAKGSKGEVKATICSTLREGTELCITEPWSIEVLCEQVRLLAEQRVDFFQILDQNHGAESFCCYDRTHHHPPLPGAWQSEAMRELIAQMRAEAAAAGYPMLIGCENVAALPYIAPMPFNDVRDPITYGTPVPVTQYLFHEYGNNFMGNESGAWQEIDCPGCPDNLQFRMAQSFVRGEMTTLVLRDSGEIDWGAAADWDAPAPKQAPLLELVKIFNRMRRTYPRHLVYGAMRKPLAELKCADYVLKLKRRHTEERYPAVSSGTFRDEIKGKSMEFLVNFREQPEPVTLTSPDKLLRLTVGGKQVQFRDVLETVLPPLSVAVLAE